MKCKDCIQLYKSYRGYVCSYCGFTTELNSNCWRVYPNGDYVYSERKKDENIIYVKGV